MVVSESPSTCPSTWIFTSRDFDSLNNSPTSSDRRASPYVSPRPQQGKKSIEKDLKHLMLSKIIVCFLILRFWGLTSSPVDCWILLPMFQPFPSRSHSTTRRSSSPPQSGWIAAANSPQEVTMNFSITSFTSQIDFTLTFERKSPRLTGGYIIVGVQTIMDKGAT